MKTKPTSASKSAAATKKTTAKKPVAVKKAKKAAAKKPAAKKATTKKATVKKPAAKKPAVKKTAPKKTTAKKATAKKPVAAKKPAAAGKSAPAKNTARPGVAKVSPLAGMAVGDWIAKRLAGWQAEVAGRLIDLVRSAAPDAEAAIKWSQPVFVLNGPFAYLRGGKSHVTFGFWRGTELADPRNLLEGEGDRMKHMKITAPGHFDLPIVRAFIVEAARLNRDKGDPTRR